MKRSIMLGLALLLAVSFVFVGCSNTTSSSDDDGQRGVLGQISGIVIDGSTGLPLSDVTVEIAGKKATTDSAGYYVVENVIPNDGARSLAYTASFHKDGYTAAQDANIQVDPNEYINTDPFLEKQVLLKLEEYFNTWLSQTYGNGTTIVQGEVDGDIALVGGGSNTNINNATFWGTVNDAGDIITGNISGELFGPLNGNFTANVTGGNINLGNITISGQMTSGGDAGSPIQVGADPLTITGITVSGSGGNWTYAGGVYYNEDGTLVQVTADPQNPEIPQFDLKGLEYAYTYGQSLETVYLYPMNSSISGKILTLHNVGVEGVKIEFSNMPNPVVGDVYAGAINAAAIANAIELASDAAVQGTIAPGATFVGYYNAGTGDVSGTLNGSVTVATVLYSFTGTVTGTAAAPVFTGKLSGTGVHNGKDIVDTAALVIGPAGLTPLSGNVRQVGKFYGEGETNASGEFTVTGVPAGQALYIQIPGFTDAEGRYYSGKTLYSVNNGAFVNPYSPGPYVSQRNATVALPTIYLKAEADIATVTESSLGTPRDRLPIFTATGDPSTITVSFSKAIDTTTFSATITTGAAGVNGAKNVADAYAIGLDVVSWEPDGKKVTLKANNVKLPNYHTSGILPYWNGTATLSIGNLAFGANTKAADGSILIDPVTAAPPSLPVYTELGLTLLRVEILTAAASGARSILQQGGEIKLYFNKEVAQTESTRFTIGGVQQAWKVDTDAKIVHVYNDRPITGNELITEAGYPVRTNAELNDTFAIPAGLVASLALYNPDTERLAIVPNPYLGKTDPQSKLNAEKVGTNLLIGAANPGWDPLKDIVLEFNQQLNATPAVAIYYSPSPGEYRLTTAGATVTALGGNAYRIDISGGGLLLAPGQTYYLAFIADPAAAGVLNLEVDPRRSAASSATNELGANIQITIEAENADRFYELDTGSGLGGSPYNDGITFTSGAPTGWWPSATLKGDSYSVAPGSSADGTREIQAWTALTGYATNPKWTKSGTAITISSGPKAGVALPEITVPTTGYQFYVQYRGTGYTGRVIKWERQITPPAASVTSVTGAANIAGVVGIPKATQYFTVNLGNDTFKAIARDADVSSWFKNLPAGLTVQTANAVVEGAASAVIKIGGTPTAASTEDILGLIPQGATNVGAPLALAALNAYDYAIVAPSASISSAALTVTGVQGAPVTAGGDVTITLSDAANYFNTDIAAGAVTTGDWIFNAPNGITVTAAVVAVGDTSVTLTIEGTPATASDERIEFKIPANLTRSGGLIVVPVVNNVLFGITEH